MTADGVCPRRLGVIRRRPPSAVQRVQIYFYHAHGVLRGEAGNMPFDDALVALVGTLEGICTDAGYLTSPQSGVVAVRDYV